MFIQRILKWLTVIGVLVGSYFTLPQFSVPLGNGQTWQLNQLPTWGLGLGVVIVLLLVFKIVTHIITRLLMFAALIVLVFIMLSYFNVPVWPWLQSQIKF